jgi:thioredoxin-like negative regulator of GroEL
MAKGRRVHLNDSRRSLLLTVLLSRAGKKHAATTDAYKVNVDDFPTAKKNLKLEQFPAVVVFKVGKEPKRVEGLNPEKTKEIAEVPVPF